MWKLTVRGLWTRKRRLFSTSLSVVLGVAFLAATLMLGDTMRTGFDTLFTNATAGTDVVVRSATSFGSDDDVASGGIDPSLVDTIAAVDGVDRTAVVIEAPGQIVAADGTPIESEGPPTIAANWIDDPELGGYALAEGRAPTGPGEVVIDRGSAQTGDLQIGDTTRVLVPEPIEVTIVGLATYGGSDSMSGMTFAGFSTEEAARLLHGGSGQLDEIVVAAVDGVSQETLRERVATALPADAEALTGAQYADDLNDEVGAAFLDAFEKLLLAFAAIALFVALFSIHNTFSILVAQRTRESALLRAVGASSGQVLRTVCAEALAVGVVASGVGLGVGALLAMGLRELMEGFGLELPVSGVVVTTSTVVIALSVGIVVTLVASIVPAVRAGRVAPIAALREAAIDGGKLSLARGVIGALVLAGGVATVLTATIGEEQVLQRAGLGALVSLVGAVLLGPAVARPAVAVMGAPMAAVTGNAGRLARRNAMRNPRRTAATASALLVGTAVVALFTTVGSSLKASIDDTVSGAFRGDLVVEAHFNGAGLPASFVDGVAALPDVAAAAPYVEATVQIDGSTVYPTAIDPARSVEVVDLDVVAGDLAALQRGEVAMGSKTAEDRGLVVGDTVPVDFADGSTEEFTLAVLYDLDSLFGDFLMTTADLADHTTDTGPIVMLIDVADGADVSATQAAIDRLANERGAPASMTADEYVGTVAAEIDQMLILVYGLLGLAIVIALMGIANTLSLSVHERTKELGLLRAVGQSRRQLRRSIRWEAALIAVFGTIGGIALGTFCAWGLVQAMKVSEGLGTFAIPFTPLIVVLVLAALAGTLAATRPARRAARLDVLSALAAE